jgi:restriction endonuclease Mrr
MPLPSHSDVDLALHVELVRAGRVAIRRETYDDVAKHFPAMTAEDRARTRKNGYTKVFNNLVNWSRNRMRVRGLLVDGLPQGQWQTNDKARPALLEDLMARGVQRARAETFISGAETLADLLGPDWAKPLRSPGGDGDAEPDVPEAPVEQPSEQKRPAQTVTPDARASIKQALLSRLNTMSGPEFEQFVGRLLDSLGFRDTQVVGRSGDEGVDVLTYFHSPFLRAKVAVQVKRHTNNVGPRDISYLRDRWARRSDRLLFITTADFTSGAQEVAADEHEKQVDLVNGTRLVDVMVEHGFGVTVRPQVTYDIDEAYFTT